MEFLGEKLECSDFRVQTVRIYWNLLLNNRDIMVKEEGFIYNFGII